MCDIQLTIKYNYTKLHALHLNTQIQATACLTKKTKFNQQIKKHLTLNIFIINYLLL